VLEQQLYDVTHEDYDGGVDRKKRAGDRLRLKCDDTRAETRFCLSAKRTSPLWTAASGQSNTGS